VLETICEKELLKTFVAESQVADDVVVVVVSPGAFFGTGSQVGVDEAEWSGAEFKRYTDGSFITKRIGDPCFHV